MKNINSIETLYLLLVKSAAASVSANLLNEEYVQIVLKNIEKLANLAEVNLNASVNTAVFNGPAFYEQYKSIHKSVEVTQESMNNMAMSYATAMHTLVKEILTQSQVVTDLVNRKTFDMKKVLDIAVALNDINMHLLQDPEIQKILGTNNSASTTHTHTITPEILPITSEELEDVEEASYEEIYESYESSYEEEEELVEMEDESSYEEEEVEEEEEDDYEESYDSYSYSYDEDED